MAQLKSRLWTPSQKEERKKTITFVMSARLSFPMEHSDSQQPNFHKTSYFKFLSFVQKLPILVTVRHK
jgi:hypothetical protein